MSLRIVSCIIYLRTMSPQIMLNLDSIINYYNNRFRARCHGLSVISTRYIITTDIPIIMDYKIIILNIIFLLHIIDI